jgi:hypothetical protein
MLLSFTFWLGVVAVLIAYLFFSVGRRWVAEEAKRRAEEKKPAGTSFDASAIAPQIQRVRRDHLAAVQSRPHDASYKAGLLVLARRMVATFPYFQRASHDHKHEIQGHGG